MKPKTNPKPASDQVLTSHKETWSRHPTQGYMMCSNCHDRRRMKDQGGGVSKCQKCGQLWKLP